jgi:hypothetical protein
MPWPRQYWHDASVSKRGSRYFRPKPWRVGVTCQPRCRAVASGAANRRCVRIVRLDFIQVSGPLERLFRWAWVVRWGISATSLRSGQAAGWVEEAGPV